MASDDITAQMLRVKELRGLGYSYRKIGDIIEEEFGKEAKNYRTFYTWANRFGWDKEYFKKKGQAVSEIIHERKGAWQKEVPDYQTIEDEVEELKEAEDIEEATVQAIVKYEDSVLERENQEAINFEEKSKQIEEEYKESIKSQYRESIKLRRTAIALINRIVAAHDSFGRPIKEVGRDGKKRVVINEKFDPGQLMAASTLYRVSTSDCRELEEVLGKQLSAPDDGMDEGFAIVWRKSREALDFNPIVFDKEGRPVVEHNG